MKQQKWGVEIKMDFVIGVLLALCPWGADQMNLPHNFWLGLTCWIVAIVIAIRMFWIFPVWVGKRTSLEKSLLIVIAIGACAMLFYAPIKAAYLRRNESQTKSDSHEPKKDTQQSSDNQPQEQPKAEAPKPAVKPIPITKAHKDSSQMSAYPLRPPKNPFQDNSVHVDNGSRIDQRRRVAHI